MLKWLRSLFSSRRRYEVPPHVAEAYQSMRARFLRIKARYDAAITNDDNRRHWGNADGLSAASANSASVRRRLRNRSRYENDNNGYACGIVRARADDMIGTGPTLQINSPNDALNEQIETAFAKWAKATRFAEKLHCMDMARCRDGEAFALFVNNEALSLPVTLDLHPIEADQIGDPFGEDIPRKLSTGGFRLDGVEYDRWGNPIRYSVLREHPGDLLRSFPMEFDVYNARQVLHWYRMDRPGQLRGVPELTASLPLFAYLRRWTLASLSAAELAASFAALLETDLPPDAETDEPVPFESLEIERGMMTTLPWGTKMHQFKSEHPVGGYGDFKREVLSECGRPVRMPVNVVTGDSSQHNFSSAKLDHFGYRGGLKTDRAFTEINVLDRVYVEFVREAEMVGMIPRADAANLPRSWHLPGWPSMDKDEAKHVTERLSNGTTTLQEEAAADGKDWKDRIRQRGREMGMMAEEGVTQAAAAPQPQEEPQGDEQANEADAPAQAEAASRNGHSRFSTNGAA